MRPEGPAPVANAVWLEPTVVLRAGVTGIFSPAVQRAQRVSKGSKIGHVTDFHGRTLETITAPFDAEILYVVATPPVSKGEPVAMIGAHAAGK